MFSSYDLFLAEKFPVGRVETLLNFICVDFQKFQYELYTYQESMRLSTLPPKLASFVKYHYLSQPSEGKIIWLFP